MSNLRAFPTEAKAEEVRQKLLARHKGYLIEFGDAVIAVKNAKAGAATGGAFTGGRMSVRTGQKGAERPVKTGRQRAGIEHAKANGESYRGRKPSYTRAQLATVQDMLGQSANVIQIAKATNLSRQTVYRIKGDPAAAEAALATREVA
jgi:Helix-turn-helix domain of resolvase